jgi:hypothetical protein
MENRKHRLVMRQHISLESYDAVLTSDSDQMLQEETCNSSTMVGVARRKRQFCTLESRIQTIACFPNQFLRASNARRDHERDHAIRVHLRNLVKLGFCQLPLMREEACESGGEAL